MTFFFNPLIKMLEIKSALNQLMSVITAQNHFMHPSY